MKAMILAAGKGTRVRPITWTLPKPMIPLIRKPVMELLIEHLRRHGIVDIAINTSHLAPLIENYFRDGERFGVRIAYSFEGSLVNGELQGMAVGSAGGMRKIQDFSGFFDETFVVICGDALVDVDLAAVLRFHREREALATIVLRDVPREEVTKYGVVEVRPDGRVLRFQEKPSVAEAVSSVINTGIYLFEPRIFDFIPPHQEFDIGGQLFPALVRAEEALYGVVAPFHWLDIGSVPDFWEATRLLLQNGLPGFTIPGREVRPGVHAGIHLRVPWEHVKIEGPVYIGSGTEIAPGATVIGPAVIGSGCMLKCGAFVRECILADYTRVSSVAGLEEKIIFGNKCIDPSGKHLDIDESQIGWIVDDARKALHLTEAEAELWEHVQDLAATK
jgi:mannose-1-phosphate guanylyltransferase